MKHKYNPMVSLVALVLLALILVLTCTGCTTKAEAAETAHRFTVKNAGDGCKIITDNETAVQYLFYSYGTTNNNRAGGLTKLED